jgi:hypothetical protein
MRRNYIVITDRGDVSYSPKTDQPESFLHFLAAKARAASLAKLSPGETIRIYELTAEAIAPVQKVSVSRAHPLEHYKRQRP